MKIVVIGAGGKPFGRTCLADFLGHPVLREMAPEIVLVDVDAERLDTMLRFGESVRDFRQSGSEIWATTSEAEALPGADYVLISVTRRRYELWEQDYRVPVVYGFMQPYGENGGPGALFHALRSIHLILPICRDIERFSPDAMVFNYSNPESRVLLAMRTLTSLRSVGLCHGQQRTRRLISEYLNKPAGEIETVGAGINHFFWFQEIVDRETGEDLYPRVREAVARDETPDRQLMRKMVEIFGLISHPKDYYLGEFVQFAPEFCEARWRYGREAKTAPEEIVERERIERDIDAALAGETPIEEVAWLSEEMGVPMIAAHATDRLTRFISGNVLNDHLTVPNLLPDAVVETPVDVDGSGFHPAPVAPLPECLAAFCRRQMSIQKLTVEAYRERSRDLLLQALLLDPFVNSIRKAEALLDEMLELQAEYLPAFG